MVPRRLPILRLKDGIDFPDLKDEVEELQRKLRFPQDKIDGKFGSATEEAVKRFQRDQGLLVDGIVGQKTWIALLNEVVEVYNPHLNIIGSFDVDKIVDSIPFPNIRASGRVSVPIILRECLASDVTDRGQVAYILATAEHESHLGELMEELTSGWEYEGRDDLGNTESGDGPLFKGRGLVQITGRKNYTYWSHRLGIDLISNPEKATDLPIAAKILVQGMRDGTFTEFKLSDFISGATQDFEGARQIINGFDKAELIAAIAREYLKVL
jgi:predicted chitinase